MPTIVRWFNGEFKPQISAIGRLGQQCISLDGKERDP